MKIYLFILITFLASIAVFGQKTKDLNIDYMLRGSIYAGSSIEDENALGGFASSNNIPKKIESDSKHNGTNLFLKIDTTSRVVISEKYNGYSLLLINKTDTTINLEASDSRLYVVAEAFVKGAWVPIEYLPSSWCGNSYHTVYINPNEYWNFKIPVFNGKIKTKIRYRLKTPNGFIYSNEIVASINKRQLTEKQDYNSKGLMDPYND